MSANGHHPISFSNPNTMNMNMNMNNMNNMSASTPHYNGSRAPYKRSDRFSIARPNIRSSSGNGYSSLSTKSVTATKTQFDFSSVANGNNNNHSNMGMGNDHTHPSSRRFRTISPRAAALSSFNKGQHVTMPQLIDGNNSGSTNASPANIRRQFVATTLSRLPSGHEIIGARSKSNPNILGIYTKKKKKKKIFNSILRKLMV